MRSLSPVFEERTYYKPFEYPWAFDYYTIQNQLHWLPEDVPMHEDVKDWNQKLSPSEKNLLTQIFRLFTQSDVDVGSGYYEKYIPMFKKPELRMMMGSFANMESIHQHAYSLLLDTEVCQSQSTKHLLSTKRCQLNMTTYISLKLLKLKQRKT